MGIINLQFFRKIGFYFSAVSAVTLIAAVLSYMLGFTDLLLEYNSPNVLPIAIVGIVLFFVLLLIGPTSNLAPLAMWITSLISLATYISNIYMYFTGIFYNGISAEAFKLIDGSVMLSTILFIVSFVAGNVAMYMDHSSDF